MTVRAEELKKMSKLEIEVNSKIAAQLYDRFAVDTKSNIVPKEAFILGYLHGVEAAYEEIGMFDDPDDNSKVYDFIKKNEGRI